MAFRQAVEPVVTSHRHTKPALATQAEGPPLPPVLERLFGLIAEPVRKLEAAPDGPLTVREIGLLLGDVLGPVRA